MGYNLVIDQGNSTAKVAVFDGRQIVERRRYETLTEDVIRRLSSRYPIGSAIYCSVAAHGEHIIVALRSIASKVYELTSLLPLPVKIAYTTPSTLGRDRIAAVAGARSLYPDEEVLVVDAGTAVTYDLLKADGTFAGGNIAPGLWMRAEALHQMTRRLRSTWSRTATWRCGAPTPRTPSGQEWCEEWSARLNITAPSCRPAQKCYSREATPPE